MANTESSIMIYDELVNLEMGTQIAFRTYHTADSNLYEGVIVGRGSYSIVNPLMDILPYYKGVQKAIPDLKPMTELEYFIIEYSQTDITDGSRSTKLFVCAYDWVNLSDTKIISLKEHFDIRIYNRPSSEAAKIIQLLQSHGYTCNKIDN